MAKCPESSDQERRQDAAHRYSDLQMVFAVVLEVFSYLLGIAAFFVVFHRPDITLLLLLGAIWLRLGVLSQHVWVQEGRGITISGEPLEMVVHPFGRQDDEA